MLTWQDIEKFVTYGNPPADQRILKTGMQWRSLLENDVYEVARNAGTERPFSSPMCSQFELRVYSCACCDTLLFDSS